MRRAVDSLSCRDPPQLVKLQLDELFEQLNDMDVKITFVLRRVVDSLSCKDPPQLVKFQMGELFDISMT